MIVAGKVALITGGANGIGFAIAKELLKNGAKGICLFDIVESTGASALAELLNVFGSNKAIFVNGDVRNDEDFRNAFIKTIEVYNQLDIVFNNAAVLEEHNWQKTVDTNLGGVLRGTFLAMQEYFPKYKSGEEGIIVNMSSIAGIEPYPPSTVYAVTKAAIINLGRNISYEEFYEKYKVKVLTFCPGPVDTGLLKARILPERSLLPDTATRLMEGYKDFVNTSEFIAENVVSVLDKGTNGSIWVIQKEQPAFEVVFPKLEAIRKCSLE